jgi:hypothetical protein
MSHKLKNITNADFFKAVFHTMDPDATAWGTAFSDPADNCLNVCPEAATTRLSCCCGDLAG